jgi:hypothetical protein
MLRGLANLLNFLGGFDVFFLGPKLGVVDSV